MRILFLSQRVPFPPVRGDKITTWKVIERLRRDHAVRVVAFAHDDADREAARELERLGFEVAVFPHHRRRAQLASLPLLLTRTPLTLGVYGSRALQAEVDRAIGECDLAWAYSSSMGAFFLAHDALPRVMQMAELDSDKWRQYAESRAFPASWVYRREHRRLLEFERRLAHAVELNLFCTPLEERIFQQQIPGCTSAVLPNGVDLARFTPAPELAEPGHVVFCGVMDYFPNVDACVRYARHVLPRLRRELPEARFTIVGSHPTSEVLALADLPGVSVTGFVPDTRALLRRAALSVAPMRIARGIQNKVLEAMSMGLPVVASPCAVQGVGARPGTEYVVADTDEELFSASRDLLRDRDRARALGHAARQWVEEHCDWERVLARVPLLLEETIRRFQARGS